MTDYFKSKKIAIFSDLHIGVHQNSRAWHTIAQEWAGWIIAELKSKKIKDIVFCGDYFHTRDEISVDTLSFGTSLLEMFEDFNVTMITGNHCCYLRDSSEINSLAPFKHWPNINVVDKPTTVNSHGKTFNFIPWGTSLDDVPEADTTFGHFEIKLFKMNSFALCDSGFESKELLSKSKLIVSGHFHLRDERHYENGTILYVGNPFQMDFNDAASSKGYYIFNVENNTYNFFENTSSPRHYNVTLSQLVAEGNITDVIKELFLDNLIKLKIDRRISPDDLDFLLNKLKTLKPLQLQVDHEYTNSEYDLEEEKKDLSGINIEQAITEFIDLMDINNRQEVLSKTLELYSKVK